MIPRSERRVWTPAANGMGSKQDFRRLEAHGVFGNAFRSWPSFAALRRDQYEGWLRIGSREASSRFKINEVHSYHVGVAALDLIAEGAREESMFFGEVPAPDNRRLINFEVFRNENYLHLDWGTGQKPLRDDLNDRLHEPVTGAKALAILRHFLGHEYDVIDELWDGWPAAHVEGSCWERPVGTLKRRLIIWEARQY